MPGIIPNFTIPFLVTLAFIAALRPAARHIGLVDRPGGRKMHDGEVPVIGGLCMMAGMVIGGAIIIESLAMYPTLIAGAVMLAVVGALDDRFQLRASVRLAFQMGAGVIALSGGVLVSSLGTFGSDPLSLHWVAAIIFTLLTFSAFTNAFNWQDGGDGLAGGQAFVCLLALLVADLNANGEHIQLITALIGCIAAFLAFNAPFQKQASAYLLFMGDAGALFLGFALAWLAIEMSQGPEAVIAPVTALWIGALPVLDFFGCMLRRIVTGRAPFSDDDEHLHHLLRRAGLSRQSLFWTEVIICFVFAGVGLVGHFLGINQGLMLAAMGVIFVVYFWVFGSGKFFQRIGDPRPSQPQAWYFPRGN